MDIEDEFELYQKTYLTYAHLDLDDNGFRRNGGRQPVYIIFNEFVQHKAETPTTVSISMTSNIKT